MWRVFLSVVCLFLAVPAYAAEYTGRVVGVTDGDTITLIDRDKQQYKIRLAGIDAPESHQPFGQKSKASLSALVFNREVTAECGKTDRYRRLICKILLDGVDVNLEQVKVGVAWHYKQYANEQIPGDREAYAVAELDARTKRLGLWTDLNPMPPWDWRRR